MFSVLFNDLKEAIDKSGVITYADDTVILFADKEVQSIEDALNHDMTSIRDCCYRNGNVVRGKRKLCPLEPHKG